MNINFVQEPPIPVLMIRHTGPYEQLPARFDELWNWTQRTGVPTKRCIGIYWDNPQEVAQNQLRSAACYEIPHGYSLPQTLPPSIQTSTIAGGEYAVTRFVGPYEVLEAVWSQFISQIEGKLGRRISENPAFEVYVNDASETPAKELITDLYMPLA